LSNFLLKILFTFAYIMESHGHSGRPVELV
jgi:hypothetical protein